MNEKLIFNTRYEFRLWLEKNAQISQGVWLVFIKGHTLSAADALEEALCFGWIDGTIKNIEKDKYIKYFARRTKKSNWSEKNKKVVLNLLEKGLVSAQGLDEIEKAKQNGMWNRIQINEVTEAMFDDFRNLICQNELALTNYDKMAYSHRKMYVLLYMDAKSEQCRTNRLARIINRLEQNQSPM